MRAFLDILTFELRYQLKAPLFWIIMLLFFLMHFLTMGTNTITIGEINNLINLNSPYQVILVETGLSYFYLLPLIFFIVTAIMRDHVRQTAEFFLTSPIGKVAFLLGRFCGGLLPAIFVIISGLGGSFSALLMPWIDPARLATLSGYPFAYSFFMYTLPYTFAVCSLFFMIASLTKSYALTFGMAALFMVLSISLHLFSGPDVQVFPAIADPTGALVLRNATRYWTITELNTLYPSALLFENRLFWCALALTALIVTCCRFKFDLSQNAAAPKRMQLLKKRCDRAYRPPSDPSFHLVSDFSIKGRLAIFANRLRTDILCILRNPLFWIVLALSVRATFIKHRDLIGAMELPLVPATSLLLEFFRHGFIHYMLLVIIYFSGELIHRDRESRVHEIVASSPYPDWIMTVSAITALSLAIGLLLAASMVTSICLQASAGYTQFELGLYIKGLFVYHEFYFYMCIVLAVFVQVLSPGKWIGMLLLVCIFACLFSMNVLGFENILYQYSIPRFIHSQMNGWGPYEGRIIALIAYWGAFCVLLMMASVLIYPRGYYASMRQRIDDARSRISIKLVASTVIALMAFITLGAWIYYNTHVLNDYITSDSELKRQADYEKAYGRYEKLPSPNYSEIDLEVDLYPAELRLDSRGIAQLVNNTERPMDRFAISFDPRMQVRQLEVDSAQPVRSDLELGFYLFKFESPLAPKGVITLRWNMSRANRGFVNGNPDFELVKNGTYIVSAHVMPVPGYVKSQELTKNSDRRRFGLPPADRLPTLEDPAYLDVFKAGVNRRATMRITMSTAPDQIAVATGMLQREWRDHGRRYFRYVTERPIWPGTSLFSARYEVARDTWEGVSLEVYYDTKHAKNARIMLETAKRGLSYYNNAFGPYGIPYFRIVEFARYRNQATASHGTVAYSESVGFITDMAAFDNLDYATLHELAHMWWGDKAYGAYMQGRQMLNETLAQYSTFMVFKEHPNPVLLRRILSYTHHNYLLSRGWEREEELPLIFTEDQGYISYYKGALVMFALQDIIGSEKMSLALRSYLDKFAYQPPPFPTSRDLVHELRAVAGPEYQSLITDLFEKITLYDLRVDTAEAAPISGGYEVEINYSARQFEADGQGVEREVPLDSWFDIVIFPRSEEPLLEQIPLYQHKHRIKSGQHQISVRVTAEPGMAGIDPYHKMIDRTPSNNLGIVNLQRGQE